MSQNLDPKILVVDDEPVLRAVVSESLERSGYKVFEAGDGNAAFEVVCQESIDLVISDLRMPHCNGIELLKKINSLDPKLRPAFALITGYSDVPDADPMQLGAFAVLKKPFSKKNLIELVQTFPRRSIG